MRNEPEISPISPADVFQFCLPEFLSIFCSSTSPTWNLSGVKPNFGGQIPFRFCDFSSSPKANKQKPKYGNPTTENTPGKVAFFANRPNFMQQISIAPMEVQM